MYKRRIACWPQVYVQGCELSSSLCPGHIMELGRLRNQPGGMESRNIFGLDALRDKLVGHFDDRPFHAIERRKSIPSIISEHGAHNSHPAMITRFFTNIKVRYQPFNLKARSARLFLQQIPPKAWDHVDIDVKAIPNRHSPEQTLLWVKFSTFRRRFGEPAACLELRRLTESRQRTTKR
jgi:hypothetical protein